MSEFELPKREVSTAELDLLVKLLKEANEDYDRLKAISTEAYHKAEELENKLVALLTEANKSVYVVEGVARVTIVSKTQVTTPKTIDQKKEFFGWIERTMGQDALIAYQSINYASLNSLYNKELEKAVSQGRELNIPGLELPMVVKSLSVRKQ